jgi:hypothetical protein
VKKQRELQVQNSSTKDAKEYAKKWWLFGKPREELRPALVKLSRYLATVETTKHRVFQFLGSDILPDNMLIAIASDDGYFLGVLSSHIHVTWALRLGGWRCFDPFPFPDPDPDTRAEIAVIAERIDKHRKDVQAAHPDITLTEMYNVLEKLRTLSSPSPLAGEGDRALARSGEGSPSSGGAGAPPPSPTQALLSGENSRILDLDLGGA